MADRVFSCRFAVKKNWNKLRNVLNMASSDIQIAKPQRGCPERAELPDVNINTGAQSIKVYMNYKILFRQKLA